MTEKHNGVEAQGVQPHMLRVRARRDFPELKTLNINTFGKSRKRGEVFEVPRHIGWMLLRKRLVVLDRTKVDTEKAGNDVIAIRGPGSSKDAPKKNYVIGGNR